MLKSYIDKYTDSLIAVNLKACNEYRLYNSKAAENALKLLKSLLNNELSFAKDIIAHNTVSYYKLVWQLIIIFGLKYKE